VCKQSIRSAWCAGAWAPSDGREDPNHAEGIIPRVHVRPGLIRGALILSAALTLLSQHSARVRAQGFAAAPQFTASDLIAEVNALRASNGLPAYSVNPILMQIAQSHAIYQAATGTTTHYSADGSRPFQRALAAGYPVAGDLSRGGFFSENIISSPGMTAAQAVQAWTGDAPHLNTMLSPNLQDVGAGMATSGGSTYFTLDAGLASGSPVSYTPPAGSTLGTPGPAAVSDFMLPVMKSTPLESGDVIHEVQFGQTLWSLAVEYGTTVEQIRSLNAIDGIEIYEGQKLLIAKLPTPTATQPATVTVTPTGGAAPIAATRTETAVTPTATREPAAAVPRQTGGLTVLVILGSSILAAGLGTWVSLRRRV